VFRGVYRDISLRNLLIECLEVVTRCLEMFRDGYRAFRGVYSDLTTL